MTLNELHAKPLSESMAEMDMVNFKVHTDDKGAVVSIEVKYAPKDNPDGKKGLARK